MRLTKIFCNLCGSDINLETDKAVAKLDIISIRTKLNIIQPMLVKQPNPMNTEPEVIKEEYDICGRCIQRLRESIDVIISENKKVGEVDQTK